MASTLSSTEADPRFDAGAAPMVPMDHFIAVEEALATLVRATFTPDAPVGGPASDRSADAGISQSFATATLGPADPQGGADPVREQRSLGKRGALARVTIATITVCLAVSAICAWRWYGDHALVHAAASPAIESAAPPPAQIASIAELVTATINEPGAASADRQQIETTARGLAALRQTVEQLAAGQEELTREIAKLQAVKPEADKPPAEKPDKRMLRRVSALPAPPAAAPARKPAPITRQAARRVSRVSELSPPPQPAAQVASESWASDSPPLRPPMPVPQP